MREVQMKEVGVGGFILFAEWCGNKSNDHQRVISLFPPAPVFISHL